MSKKLICLFLSLVLLLSVCLTGCGDKSLDEAVADKVEQASEAAVTLSMFLMSDGPVSAETAAKIEDALNDITENKYTIRMKLYFYEGEEEYYSNLEAAFAARAEAEANGTLRTDVVQDENAAETALDEYGKVQIIYPAIADYQVDLFYLNGQDRFNTYLKDGRFADVDDQLQSSIADKQFDYMPSHYFNYFKAINGGDSYAVANAKAIGDYTYLLLNKDALEAAGRRSSGGTTTYEEYTSLTCEEVQDFLAYVSDSKSGLTDTYYPLYTNLTSREMLLNNVQFMGVDANGKMSDSFSVIGGYLQKATMKTKTSYTNMYAELTNLMEDETFLGELETLVKYEEEGYYSTNEESGKDFAVGYVTGGAEMVLEYGDKYEMIPVGMPMLAEEEVYEDMFAVSSYSSSSSKAMQILNLINTDETVRNLLLYGIEGEHYQLVDSELKDEFGEYYKLAERLNDEYPMTAARTGNTLIITPEKPEKKAAAEGEAVKEPDVIPNIKEYMVQQNLDAVVNLSSGFQPSYESAKAAKNGLVVNAGELQVIRALSETIWSEYLKCETVADFAAFKTWAETEMAKADYQDENGTPVVAKHLGYQTEDGKVGHLHNGEVKQCNGQLRCKTESLVCVYNAWLKDAVKIVR